MIKLIVDCREHHIIDILKKQDVSFEQKQLLIGDFVLNDSEGFNLIFERKTWADLQHSLHDSRFREQRSRLLSSRNEKNKIAYIIEGPYREEYQSIKHALYRLNFAYDIPILYSISHFNTIYILKDFLSFQSLTSFFQPRSINQDQIESRTLKKNYDDPLLFFGSCLASIKGISTNVALAITAEFPSLLSFYNHYFENNDNFFTKLKAIKYITTKNNTKHISKTLLDKILSNFGIGESIFIKEE